MALASPADVVTAGELSSPRVRRLGVVVGLPLADGVFVTLVLAGILESIVGILVTGLVIFGGSAAAAVILADVVPDADDQLRGVVLLGAIIVPVAGIQAAVAPSVAMLFDIPLLERFAVLVLLVIALDLANDRIGQWMPRPGIIVLLGLLASLRFDGPVVLGVDPGLFGRGALAAGIGVAMVSALVMLGPRIRPHVTLGWLRYGGAASLLVLAFAIVSGLPEVLALGVLGMAMIGAVLAD